MIARAGSCVLRDTIITAIIAASAWSLFSAPAAAQDYPQAANGGAVIVNYGALLPTPAYGTRVYSAPAGYASYTASAPLPRSTFNPYGVAPYGAQPHAAPLPNGYRYAPVAAGFAPYGPALYGPALYGPALYGPALYGQTVTPFGTYSEKVVLKNPGKKTNKKAVTEPSFVAPMESAPATDTQMAEAAPQVPAAEPMTAEAVPPAEPETMPTNVPSPVPTTAADAAVPETPAIPTPPATEAAPATDQQAAVTPDAPAAETPATETPAAEAPAEPAAADPNASAVLPAGGVRIVFEGDADQLPEGSTGDLDQIAQKMLADDNMRVQVMAYATGTVETENKARRKSLARGLAVRSYLIKAGVRSTRIDVRALGSKSEGTPADRVDVVPAS